MIGVSVTFRYGDNFDERAVRKIAETARERCGIHRHRFNLGTGGAVG